MINFSISERSAQPGLCAEDITEKRTYGTAVSSETIDLSQFARHIASHGSVYKRSDIQAVITEAVDCLREILLDGKNVQLGELGIFSIGLKTRGANSPAEFTSDNITGIHVNWTPGKEFRNLRKDAEFHLVPRQKDVDKALKDQKGIAAEEEKKEEGGTEQE